MKMGFSKILAGVVVALGVAIAPTAADAACNYWGSPAQGTTRAYCYCGNSVGKSWLEGPHEGAMAQHSHGTFAVRYSDTLLRVAIKCAVNRTGYSAAFYYSPFTADQTKVLCPSTRPYALDTRCRVGSI